MPLRHDFARTTVVQAFARTMQEEGPETAEPGSRSVPVVVSERPVASEKAPLPSACDVVGGHYKLVRLLGEGMFGKVYAAQRLDVPEHQVALKLLRRSLYAGRNVERELVMLATVGHPNVVQLKDHGTTPDYVWLTMPIYQGETLAQRLDRGTLSPREAYDIFLPVARGLEALHAAGLRHQDVKPENIYLAVFGGRVHPILLDLGVAAENDATFVAGTALYAAPEQVAVLGGSLAATPLSEKMDTYGLASTLLVAIVGPEHFPGEHAKDRIALTKAHEERTRAPLRAGVLPEVTGAPRDLLAAAFCKWLAFDPAVRPAMKELAEQLDVLLEPERAEERLFEQGISQQRVTIQRFKAVVGAMLVIGVAGLSVVYTKREMLQVAAELDVARRRGNQSFDQLDTCVASHQMTRNDLDHCMAARASDREGFDRSLSEVVRTGSTSEADRAREAQRWTTRLKACEDGAAATKRTFEDEMAQMVAESGRQRADLTHERDEARSLAEAEKIELAALGGERTSCQAERATCVEDLKTCRATERSDVPAEDPSAHRTPWAPNGARSTGVDGGSSIPSPEGSVTPPSSPGPASPAPSQTQKTTASPPALVPTGAAIPSAEASPRLTEPTTAPPASPTGT